MSLFVSFFVLVPKGVQGETRRCPRPPKSAHGGAQGYLKGNPAGAQGTQKGSWGICSGHGGGKAAGPFELKYQCLVGSILGELCKGSLAPRGE